MLFVFKLNFGLRVNRRDLGIKTLDLIVPFLNLSLPLLNIFSFFTVDFVLYFIFEISHNDFPPWHMVNNHSPAEKGSAQTLPL